MTAKAGRLGGTMGLIAVKEAARRFPISGRRIRELLQSGAIRGVKFGETWAVDEDSIRAYLDSPRRRGPKPKKG